MEDFWTAMSWILNCIRFFNKIINEPISYTFFFFMQNIKYLLNSFTFFWSINLLNFQRIQERFSNILTKMYIFNPK